MLLTRTTPLLSHSLACSLPRVFNSLYLQWIQLFALDNLVSIAMIDFIVRTLMPLHLCLLKIFSPPEIISVCPYPLYWLRDTLVFFAVMVHLSLLRLGQLYFSSKFCQQRFESRIFLFPRKHSCPSLFHVWVLNVKPCRTIGGKLTSLQKILFIISYHS